MLQPIELTVMKHFRILVLFTLIIFSSVFGAYAQDSETLDKELIMLINALSTNLISQDVFTVNEYVESTVLIKQLVEHPLIPNREVSLSSTIRIKKDGKYICRMMMLIIW